MKLELKFTLHLEFTSRGDTNAILYANAIDALHYRHCLFYTVRWQKVTF